MNTATACLAVNLSKFTSTSITDIASQAVIDAAANTDPAGTFYAMAAPAGVCTAASVDSGTEISCNIGVKGGNTLATATVICTGA
jgi:hypothetical protein